MGKLLSLGPGLKYPITIKKLFKKPGDEVKKREAIMQFSYIVIQEFTNKYGELREEEQPRLVEWDCPSDGVLKSWAVEEGMLIEHDMVFVHVEESCSHTVQFAGLCAMCGQDMTEVTWASSTVDTQRATINMIHDQTHLTISQGEASKAGEELQRRLLANRKLSLVVDLDQTIIHACIEPTVGEWQQDVDSPNYEAVKDVKVFQLKDDGPKGLASGCSYYIKMRPRLKDFLAEVSKMYELHVYTMGTRAYAANIAKIVDPDKKLFGDRIISRDENGSVTAKSLARLFPVDTKMVVIIDDRADVWPKNRSNLIKVTPYDFFKGIGDINSSFLPKREEISKPIHKKRPEESEEKIIEATSDPTPAEAPKPGHVAAEADKVKEESTVEAEQNNTPKGSALEDLVKMGGGDSESLRLEQAAEQEKFLEKQLIERPLLHRQEELDKEDGEEGSEKPSESDKSSNSQEHQRHSILKDDDVELSYLEQHLTNVHKTFYEEYDRALTTARGGRVAQLKPGKAKKVSLNEGSPDLQTVPDIGDVMPRLKSKVLGGTHILLSGLVPLGIDIMRYLKNLPEDHPEVLGIYEDRLDESELGEYIYNVCTYRSEIALQAMSFGATIHTSVSRRLTHVVAPTSKTLTHKVRVAANFPRIKIVNQLWLLESMSKWERKDETEYLVEIPESHRKTSQNSNTPSMHDSDESAYDTGSGTEDDLDQDGIPSSQDTEQGDENHFMPDDDNTAGPSPIDNLHTYDWGSMDDELADFMGEDDGEDDDDDSDTASTTRTNSRKRSTSSDRKRKHEETEEDGDSDDESTLAKKQRVANSRNATLGNNVKTPSALGNVTALSADEEAEEASNLPTPGGTGDEVDDDGDALEAELEAELENDLDAELEKEIAEGGG